MDQKLLLGIGRRDITPEIGGNLFGYNPNIYSDSIHDSLTVTAFVFRQGETSAVLLNVTLACFQTALSDRIRSMIGGELGIPVEYVFLAATHTHCGPNATGSTGWGDIDIPYVENILIPRIREAAVEAAANPVPVTVGTARGESLVGINRRERLQAGNIRLGQEAWGCFDPRMMVLSFRREDGTTLANIIHYACHGTAAGPITTITRDWSGQMIDALEAVTGGMTAYFNGCEGDVGPRLTNGRTTGDLHLMRELGAIAAQDALKVYQTITSYENAELACCAGELHLPVNPRLSVEEAQKALEAFTDENVGRQAMYAKRCQDTIRENEEGIPEMTHRNIPQSILAIGNVVFMTAPFELFSGIGLRVTKYLPGWNPCFLGMTNGYEGYVPTKDQTGLDGYEIFMFHAAAVQGFTDDVDTHIVNETIRNIQKIK